MLSGIVYNTLEINRQDEFKWIRVLSELVYITGLLVFLFVNVSFFPMLCIIMLIFLLFVETGLVYPEDVKEGEEITKGEGTFKKTMCVLSIISITCILLYTISF
jgi:hypothetical protein